MEWMKAGSFKDWKPKVILLIGVVSMVGLSVHLSNLYDHMFHNACPALSGWVGFPKQSTGYSPDKEFLLSVETGPDTEDIHVKLKSTKSGETKILEIMEKQHYGSLGSRDEGIMENRVQFSKQRSLVAVSGESASNVSLYDTSSWKKVGSFVEAAFSLSPNGKLLAVSGFNWKFGWDLIIFEIDYKEEEFVVGDGRIISGTVWCGVSGTDQCSADETGFSKWYKGQEFGFSEDGNYLVIDALDYNYFAYDLRKKSLSERSCALGRALPGLSLSLKRGCHLLQPKQSTPPLNRICLIVTMPT